MALIHAILSALSERACSGYDLAKQFDGSVGFFWKATHQQIYRELTRLEEKGLVSAEIIWQEGRPDKKLYRVTERGRKFLADWIAQPSSMSPVKDELLVKLFAGHLVEKGIIIAELERHRHQHLERLSAYRQIEQKYFADPQALDLDEKFRYLTLRNGIGYEQEWLAWCSEAIAFLS
jgi:DNA-binding PadR family transcriptional regulator